MNDVQLLTLLAVYALLGYMSYRMFDSWEEFQDPVSKAGKYTVMMAVLWPCTWLFMLSIMLVVLWRGDEE